MCDLLWSDPVNTNTVIWEKTKLVPAPTFLAENKPTSS
jgi:hypothetical protein